MCIWRAAASTQLVASQNGQGTSSKACFNVHTVLYYGRHHSTQSDAVDTYCRTINVTDLGCSATYETDMPALLLYKDMCSLYSSSLGGGRLFDTRSSCGIFTTHRAEGCIAHEQALPTQLLNLNYGVEDQLIQLSIICNITRDTLSTLPVLHSRMT